MLKAIAKKAVVFTEVLIFTVYMGISLMFVPPVQAQAAEGSRGFVSWYCTTAKQVEAVVVAPTDNDLNAVLVKGDCFTIMIMGTIVKLHSVVMNGRPPNDMVNIYSIKLDNGESVFVSMKGKGKAA